MLSVTNARFVATVVLPAITFFFGILPIAFPSRQRCPLLISAFLCFGAGVLLSVSLLHMLPEARAGVPDLAELSFCIGFLFLYLVDEVVHFFCNHIGKAQGTVCGFNCSTSVLRSSLHGRAAEQQQHVLYDQNSFDGDSGSDSEETELHYGNRLNSNHPRRFSGGSVTTEPQGGGRAVVSSYAQSLCKNERPSTSYGSMSTTERNIVDAECGILVSHKSNGMQQTSASADLRQTDLMGSSVYNAIYLSQRRRDTIMSTHNFLGQQEQNYETDLNILCHINYSPPCLQSRAGHVGLFIALTFHATLEGVAVGIEPSAEQVLLLAGALSCHKFVVAFCYGLELRASGHGCIGVFGHLFLLSLGSLLGIVLGGLLAENEHVHIFSGPAVSIIQAISAGTLLYITVCEVLPRERAKWHHHGEHRAAGILQFASLAAGFCIMYAVTSYMNKALTEG